ncbi:MAG: DUF5693 family protein [Clostridia bacterium]|jgi:hypothetical protein|nr:DUF5693 family protein [Clostridia bacterium]
MKKILYALIAVFFVVSLSNVFNKVDYEKNKEYKFVLEYNDFKKIRDEDVVSTLFEKGIGVLYKEKNIYNLVAEGKAKIIKEIDFDKDFYKTGNWYLEFANKELADRALKYMSKKIDVKIVDENIVEFARFDANDVMATYIGFGNEVYEDAKTSEVLISNHYDEDVINEAKKIKGLDTFYFIVNQNKIEEKIDIEDYNLGLIEFYKNNDLAILKSDINYKELIRMHRLRDDEVSKYDKNNLIARYELAVKERNVKTIYHKINFKDENYIETINDFIDRMDESGYKLVSEISDRNLTTSNNVKYLIALIMIAITYLLVESVKINDLVKGALIALVGIAILLSKSVLALYVAVVGPLYVISILDDKEVKSLVKAVFVSVMLGSMIQSLLVDIYYINEVFIFRGIKLSFVLPFILVAIYEFMKMNEFNIKKTYEETKELLNKNVKVIYIALGVVAISILAIMLLRSGNSNLATAFELKLRVLITNILGVRPRFKEVALAYPLLVFAIKYGKNYYLKVFAALVPISIINTFCHIYTPYMVSLQRTILGAIIGVIVGLVCYNIFEFIKRRVL